MPEQPTSPTLKKSIPPQIVYESASYELKLSEFIKVDEGSIRFYAEISDGSPLPKGIICTQDGFLTGIPAIGTEGTYKIQIIAMDDSGNKLEADFELTIKPSLTLNNPELLNKLKSQVWKALSENLPAPEMSAILNRPVSAVEIYYLMQRFATLTIWDVYNLDPLTDKKLLSLPESSPHYHIYDRGSCLIATPKDLYSHERTLADTLQTARVMAREVYQRGWAIELVGFDKMVRAAWVEIQHLGDQFGKQLEILHFSPTMHDVNVYATEARAKFAPPSSVAPS